MKNIYLELLLQKFCCKNPIDTHMFKKFNIYISWADAMACENSYAVIIVETRTVTPANAQKHQIKFDLLKQPEIEEEWIHELANAVVSVELYKQMTTC